MGSINFEKLTNDNFNINSLDEFVRHQEVRECWRRINGELVLVPNNYVEDWDLEQRRKIAETIYNGISDRGFAYGAFDEGKIIGYIFLSKDFFGTSAKYIELKLFHVSEPFRCKGIGKELFKLACGEAKMIGAEKIYISAHSSKESQAAYRRLGCVEAEEINKEIAEDEPFDIQMEYCL
ncbi:MAG: GNAT family N-acetyltransferase [Oscillospiraceae bacterium]